MLQSDSAPLIIGRDTERAWLEAFTDSTRSTGGAAVVSGEPGAGKSTLLDELAVRSSRRVLRASGIESEAELAFSVAAELLIGVRACFDRLPAAQREVLEVSLSVRAGTVSNPLAVFTAALEVLAAAAERHPLLVIVDDFSWVDGPSRQLLLFVARRLYAERIVMLFAVRDELPDDPSTGHFPHLAIPPLTRERSRELVAAAPAGLSAFEVEDVVECCGGNPLAIVEMLRAATPLATSGLPNPRPLAWLTKSWATTLDRLPAATLTAISVLAESRSSQVSDLAPVLGEVGVNTADLLPALSRQLVHEHQGQFHLRHGLLRTVVRALIPHTQRQEILAALARHADEGSAAWYRSEAVDGPDENLAERLVAVARDAQDRSGFLAAAPTWAKAAALTEDPHLRAERFLAAATAAHAAGAMSSALAWCETALASRNDPAFTADVVVIRSQARMWLGQPEPAIQDAVRTAEAVGDRDPRRAAQLYAEAIFPSGMIGRIGRMVEIADRAIALTERIDPPAAGPSLLTAAGACAAHALFGHTRRARLGYEGLQHSVVGADPLWDGSAIAIVAQAGGFLERVEASAGLCELVISTARRLSAPLVLGYALGVQGELDWWTGRWTSAYADASEASRWAEELGQGGNRGYTSAILARLDAARGDVAGCQRHADQAQNTVGSHGIECLRVYSAAALGACSLAQGDPATAANHLDRARQQLDRLECGNLAAVPFAGDLIDAHVRASTPEDARAVIDWVAARAETSDSAFGHAVVARGLGMLARTPDKAEEHFAAAHSAHNQLTAVYERARTVLAHGEVRRRWRRPGAARTLLLEARAEFVALGAQPWVTRTDTELAAVRSRSGPLADDTVAAGLRTLTPQEFQTAKLVAQGWSNVDVAASLFVSRKTIEAHLTRVYRKLGVQSRTGLVAVLHGHREFPSSRPPAPSTP